MLNCTILNSSLDFSFLNLYETYFNSGRLPIPGKSLGTTKNKETIFFKPHSNYEHQIKDYQT